MSCFSDNPELDDVSEITEIAGGGGTGGVRRVIEEFVWCVGRCGVLCEWS